VKSKRPWKKFARIERVELNSGDVKFRTVEDGTGRHIPSAQYLKAHEDVSREFESLDAAEAHLNAWWEDWWPKQIKSSRPA